MQIPNISSVGEIKLRQCNLDQSLEKISTKVSRRHPFESNSVSPFASLSRLSTTMSLSRNGAEERAFIIQISLLLRWSELVLVKFKRGRRFLSFWGSRWRTKPDWFLRSLLLLRQAVINNRCLLAITGWSHAKCGTLGTATRTRC